MTRAAQAALLSLCLAVALASAEPARHLQIEELTWTELRAEIDAGKRTILIPIGGTEQSGPHMALGKHNVRARFLAEKIAVALGDALVAPVVAYVPEGAIDPPSGHMRFPGTITNTNDAFEKTLESAARSFRRHGFHDIVLLGDHGGYAINLQRVTERLNREWRSAGVRVHVPAEYYQAASAGFGALLRGHGYTPAEIGAHAGLADTALMLAIDPSYVRRDRLGGAGGRAQGVDGDPAKATAELGREGVDLIVSRTVEALRKSIPRR